MRVDPLAVAGRIGPDRLMAAIEALAAGYAESGEPGWTRRVFSEPYRAARDWVAGQMRAAGLEVTLDAGGNVLGRLPGRSPSKPAIVLGSHSDTVWAGGRFDGIVGVLAAVAVAAAVNESGFELEHDLVVADFLGEEANPFGISCIGSRSVAGVLEPWHLSREDPDGATLGVAMERFGVDPDAALSGAWAPNSVHAYLELHIEQGPLLETSGKQIGVVTAIAGIERLIAAFTGRADHAGTMPMEQRSDALLAAASAALSVEREACGAPVHAVATSGRIDAFPGAMNVVPGSARLWAEMRSVDPAWLHGAKRRLAERIAQDASARGVDTAIEWLSDQDPVPTAHSVQDRIAQAAEGLGLTWESVPSGAGHDAAHMAHLGPMGMIFIPSIGGRSHVPEELSLPKDIVDGARVLALTALDLDSREPT
ncbi:MAG: M20 family metallo-hydrolase [Bifidobacteriaceae bacterium]|jgi:N-carbamoyl-L-amino-acid hydrolase|nr:M20 family metallo-hydrolase [Bifidobacteriaceae bacterium]